MRFSFSLYKCTTSKLVNLYLFGIPILSNKSINSKTHEILILKVLFRFSLLIVPDYEFIPVQFIKEEVTPESRNITLKAFGQEYRLYLTENKNLLSPGKLMPF